MGKQILDDIIGLYGQQTVGNTFLAAERRTEALFEALEGLMLVVDEAITRINRVEQALGRLEVAVTR